MEGKETSKKTKDVSYTYWVAKPTESKSACAPKKIDSAEAEQITSLCRQSSQGSSWNSAGTWEEKKISAEIMRTHLEKCIEQSKAGGEDWRITGINDLSGDVDYCYSMFITHASNSAQWWRAKARNVSALITR